MAEKRLDTGNAKGYTRRATFCGNHHHTTRRLIITTGVLVARKSCIDHLKKNDQYKQKDFPMKMDFHKFGQPKLNLTIAHFTPGTNIWLTINKLDFHTQVQLHQFHNSDHRPS